MPDDAPCSCGCPNTFSSKEADDDLKRYLKQGPDGTTRALIDAIVAEGVEGSTLLDIGSGIGAIQLELLAKGAASATSVDATEAYVDVALAEAAKRGFADQTAGKVGDFVAIARDLEPADVVTLDRVVCCYSNMPALVSNAASHANRIVGLVYPRVTWWVRLFALGDDLLQWLLRRDVHWYLHPESAIDAILIRSGFARREVKRTLVWQVVLYVRAPTTGSAS